MSKNFRSSPVPERMPDRNSDQFPEEEPHSGKFNKVSEISGINSYIRELVELLEQDAEMDPREIRNFIRTRMALERGERLLKFSCNDSRVVYQEYRLLAIKRVQIDGMILEDYPGLQDDGRVVREAVKQNPAAFHMASRRLRDNADIFEIAIKKDPSTNVFGSPRLRRKYGFV